MMQGSDTRFRDATVIPSPKEKVEDEYSSVIRDFLYSVILLK